MVRSTIRVEEEPRTVPALPTSFVVPISITPLSKRLPKPSIPHIPYPQPGKYKSAIRPLSRHSHHRFPGSASLLDLAAFQAGDRRAVNNFYLYLKPRLLHHLRGALANTADIELAFDDIFMEVWKKRIDFSDFRALRNFAYFRIMFSNSALNMDAAKCRNLTGSFESLDLTEEMYRESMEFSLYLYYFINRLPYPYKDVVLMTLNEYPTSEIVSRLKVSEAMAVTYYQFAVRLLRKYLGAPFN